MDNTNEYLDAKDAERKEDEYKEMNKAERRAKKILKQNNHRSQKLRCCSTCNKSIQGYPEEDRICSVAKQEGWLSGAVQDTDICDKYEGED